MTSEKKTRLVNVSRLATVMLPVRGLLAGCAVASVVAAVMLSVAGCSAPQPKNEGPSLAELVDLYNKECETLDRLEGKRKEMIAEYEAENRPGTVESMKSLTDLIGTMSEQNKSKSAAPPADPNAALDQAIRDAENTQKVTSQLLESVARATDSEGAGQPVPYSEAFQQQLDKMDAEIKAQQERVDRARQARDAADQDATADTKDSKH